MNHEEDSFSHGIRIYTEGLLHRFETEGEETVKKELEDFFGDKTLALFPDDLTKENLEKTLMSLKYDEVIYRDEKYNKKRR